MVAGPCDRRKSQHVWDARYIDAPILRDENKDADGECDGFAGGDERLFHMNDLNFNVTGVVDGTPGSHSAGQPVGWVLCTHHLHIAGRSVGACQHAPYLSTTPGTGW
jgi:hypothetical protein